MAQSVHPHHTQTKGKTANVMPVSSPASRTVEQRRKPQRDLGCQRQTQDRLWKAGYAPDQDFFRLIIKLPLASFSRKRQLLRFSSRHRFTPQLSDAVMAMRELSDGTTLILV